MGTDAAPYTPNHAHADIDAGALSAPPFAWHRHEGRSRVVLACEHASPAMPEAYAGLGLTEADRRRHIGWDLGAAQLAHALSDALDAPLLLATYSRLLRDLNRAPDAHDAVTTRSEGTDIPGNLALGADERALREARIYAPFHAELDAALDARIARGDAPVLLTVHSFTPTWHGAPRPWHAGVISRHDRRVADAFLATLGRDPALCLGDNLPYGSEGGTFHTVGRHAEARGIPGAVFEVRQDLLADDAGIAGWASRLREVVDEFLQQHGAPSA
jgi:predicted N-formylglutamate amidohydrolase